MTNPEEACVVPPVPISRIQHVWREDTADDADNDTGWDVNAFP